MFTSKTLTIELLRLAIHLTAKSETCEAKSAEHKLAGEKVEEARELKRAEGGRKYALVCQEAARMLSDAPKPVQPRQRAARPQNFSEVMAYVLSQEEMRCWPKDDVKGWFDHFNSNGWLVSGKTPMKDWHAAVSNGFRNWKEKHPDKARQTKPIDEASGARWLAFLTAKSLPCKDYATAPGYLKDDFRAWMHSEAARP